MNYGELKGAVIAFSARPDLASKLDEFRDLAEQRIYNGASEANVDPLRIASMVNVDSAFLGTLPADCLQIMRLTAIDGTYRRQLEFRPLQEVTAYQGATGSPSFFGIQSDNTVVFGPAFAGYSELLFWQRFATPVADTDTNWLLTNAPNLMLFAMLAELAQYTRDDTLLQRALARWVSAQRALQDNDIDAQHAGSTLRIAPEQSLPAISGTSQAPQQGGGSFELTASDHAGFWPSTPEPDDWLQQVHNSTLDDRSQLTPLAPYHGTAVAVKRPWFHWPRINGVYSSADDAKTYTVRVFNFGALSPLVTMTSAVFTYVRCTSDLAPGYYEWDVVDPVAGASGRRAFRVLTGAIEYPCPTRTTAATLAAARTRPRFGLTAAQIAAYSGGDSLASFTRMKVLFDNNGSGGGFQGGSLPADTPSAGVLLLELGRIVICQHLWQITGATKYRTEGLRRYRNLISWSTTYVASYGWDDAFRLHMLACAIGYDTWSDQLTTPERTQHYDLLGAQLAALLAVPFFSNVAPSKYGRRWWDSCLFAGHDQNFALTAATGSCAVVGDEALFTGSHSNLATNIQTFMEACEVLIGEFEFKGTDDGGYRGGPAYAATQHLFATGSDALAACFNVPFWEHPRRKSYQKNIPLLYPKSGTRYDGFGDDNSVQWGASRMFLGWRSRTPEMHALIETSGLSMDDGVYLQAHFYRCADPAPPLVTPTKLTHWVLDSGEWSSHSNWASTSRTSVFFRSAPMGSWNHSNLRNNCFVVKVDGVPVLVDGGRYDYFSNAAPHQVNFRGVAHKAGNCISLNTRAGGQQGYQGSNLSRSTRARMIDVNNAETWGSVTSDATASYQMGGYAHAKAMRFVVHIRPGLELVLDDHALVSGAQPWEFNFHTENLQTYTGLLTVSGSLLSGTKAHSLPVGQAAQILVCSERKRLTSINVVGTTATCVASGGHGLPLGSAVPILHTAPTTVESTPDCLAALKGRFTANVTNSTTYTITVSGVSAGAVAVMPGTELNSNLAASITGPTQFTAAVTGIDSQLLPGTCYVLFGPSSAGVGSAITCGNGSATLEITPISGAGLNSPNAYVLNDFDWPVGGNADLFRGTSNSVAHPLGSVHFQSGVMQQAHSYMQYASAGNLLALTMIRDKNHGAPSNVVAVATAGEVTVNFTVGTQPMRVVFNRTAGTVRVFVST